MNKKFATRPRAKYIVTKDDKEHIFYTQRELIIFLDTKISILRDVMASKTSLKKMINGYEIKKEKYVTIKEKNISKTKLIKKIIELSKIVALEQESENSKKLLKAITNLEDKKYVED
jgi:hypothetical protein